MLAGKHIFNMNTGLPPSLMDKLLTAVEHVLTEEGATHVWVDNAVTGSISVRAHLAGAEVVEGALSPRV